MKTPISGRSNTLPQTQPLQEHSPAQGSPSAAADSTETISEGSPRNLSHRPSAKEQALRAQAKAVQQGSRSLPTDEGQDDPTPGSPSTPLGAKRTSAQANLPPGTRPTRVQRTAQEKPSTGGALLDSRITSPRGLQASQPVPLNPGGEPREPMNPHMLSEADQLLQELEKMRFPGDEQALGILPTDEATAATHAGVGQGFNQVGEYLTTNMTSWRYKEGNKNTGVGNAINGIEIIGKNGSVIAAGNFIAEGEHGLVYGVMVKGFDNEFAVKIINDPNQYELEVKEYRYQKDVFGGGGR